MTCGFMQLATLQFEKRLQKCIRIDITIFKIFIGWGEGGGEGISSDIYVLKSGFKAPLAHRHITKFPTVYPTIYLPK